MLKNKQHPSLISISVGHLYVEEDGSDSDNLGGAE